MSFCHGYDLRSGDVVIVIDHGSPLAVAILVIEIAPSTLGDRRSARWESTDGTGHGHSDYLGGDLVERVACCGGPEGGMSETVSPFAAELGARLRAVRESQGLSLGDVAKKSGGRWPASVTGSYERSARAVTVERLAELADFYKVPVAELLPGAPPSLAAAYVAITAACRTQRENEAARFEAEIAELRSENAMLRSQIRGAA